MGGDGNHTSYFVFLQCPDTFYEGSGANSKTFCDCDHGYWKISSTSAFFVGTNRSDSARLKDQNFILTCWQKQVFYPVLCLFLKSILYDLSIALKT